MSEHTARAGTEQPDLPDLPIVRRCPYRPSVEFEPLRARGPVSRMQLSTGDQAWVVTGYAEARELLADRRVSSDRTNPNQPRVLPQLDRRALAGEHDSPLAKLGTTLLGADPPEHSMQRRLLTGGFSVKRIAALRPRIERIVAQHVDAMVEHGPPLDLVTHFALPIPSMVICELLGVPYADHEFFETQSRRRLDPERKLDAVHELWNYADRLVTARETARTAGGKPDGGAPDHGIIDDLIAQQHDEGPIDRSELVALALILLVAGHDTTANMLSLGTMALLANPDQLEALRSGEAPIEAAVEELLRYLAIVDVTTRVATSDIEIGGQVIRAGEGVVVALAAANQDPALVDRPGDLDVHRSPRHVAFGFGIHQCLGQNLARVEMEIALKALIGRFPTLRLAVPADEIRPRPGPVAGVHELPVEW